jgi:hypothetical protein
LLYWTALQFGRATLFGTWVDTHSRLLFSDQVDPAVPLATTDLAVVWVAPSSIGG